MTYMHVCVCTHTHTHTFTGTGTRFIANTGTPNTHNGDWAFTEQISYVHPYCSY